MTYRVYLRWPKQRVSNKTVTDSASVADRALRELVVSHKGSDAAAVMSVDGKNRQYIDLGQSGRQCEQCGYTGPFVDDGETCPKCALVQ